MKSWAWCCLAWAAALNAGCLLPQGDTPFVPPGVSRPTSTAAGGPLLLPPGDTPPVPAAIAQGGAATVAAPVAAAGKAGVGQPEFAPQPGMDMALPSSSSAAPFAPAPRLGAPLPGDLPLQVGREVGASEAWRFLAEGPASATFATMDGAELWHLSRQGQGWSWGVEGSASPSVSPAGSWPTAPSWPSQGPWRVAGVEELQLAGRQVGPCWVLEQSSPARGQRLRIWLAQGLGLVQQLEGPLTGEGDRRWSWIPPAQEPDPAGGVLPWGEAPATTTEVP